MNFPFRIVRSLCCLGGAFTGGMMTTDDCVFSHDDASKYEVKVEARETDFALRTAISLKGSDEDAYGEFHHEGDWRMGAEVSKIEYRSDDFDFDFRAQAEQIRVWYKPGSPKLDALIAFLTEFGIGDEWSINFSALPLSDKEVV